MEILLVLGLLYLAYNSGALTPLGVPPPSNQPMSNASNYPQGAQPMTSITAPVVNPSLGAGSQVAGANTIGLAITGATSVGVAAASAPASFAALGLTGAAAGAAVAGIGAVVAIAAALYMAHEVRKKQATNENAAVNVGVAGFDQDLRIVNAAYNSRQIVASDAIKLVQQVFAQYWQLVTPVIQPGRNGCSGGGSCPPVTAANPCTGDIGAACCVGCYDLAGADGSAHVFSAAEGGDGVTPYHFGVAGTIAVLQMGGGVVLYQQVYGSKYGGKDRPAYKLTWIQSSAA